LPHLRTPVITFTSPFSFFVDELVQVSGSGDTHHNLFIFMRKYAIILQVELIDHKDDHQGITKKRKPSIAQVSLYQ
jgi:hypothetical protein